MQLTTIHVENCSDVCRNAALLLWQITAIGRQSSWLMRQTNFFRPLPQKKRIRPTYVWTEKFKASKNEGKWKCRNFHGPIRSLVSHIKRFWWRSYLKIKHEVNWLSREESFFSFNMRLTPKQYNNWILRCERKARSEITIFWYVIQKELSKPI